MPAKTLDTLFEDILKDVYCGEKRLLRTLPKIAVSAVSEAFATLLEVHRQRTEKQVDHLEKVFAILGKRPAKRAWPVVDVLIDESLDVAEHYASDPALEAGLVAAFQAVGHHEMTRYATLTRWATMLGRMEAARLLDEALEEEMYIGADLTAFANRTANLHVIRSRLERAAMSEPVPLPDVA
jgi:ferritin-like metal-binding protein YciE